MIKEFSNLEKILLTTVFLGGGLILFIPVQKVLILFFALIILVYLLLNPKICFYIALFVSPWEKGFPIDYAALPFNQSDIFIAITFAGVVLRMLFKENCKVDVRTKLDKWIMVLLAMNLLAGVFSASHRGYQGFLRYGEVVAVYYMVVYFLRSKTVSFSELLNYLLFTGLYQAAYGMLQSFTGSFGANFQSDRGYLGYLGIGSSTVWHGRGGFDHFNQLAPFLSSIFLFFFPINHYLAKNKKRGNIILAILLFGIIITYSRGTLMALIAAFIFFLFQIQKDKTKFLLKVVPIGAFLAIASNFLKNTSYVTTLSPRNEPWHVAISAITQSTKSLFLGSGLRSYEDVAWMYIPANISPEEYGNFFAHNFFLANAIEVGLIGTGIVLAFLLNIIVSSYKRFKTAFGLRKCLNLSVNLIFFTIFFEGMFDHAFNMFSLQIWLYLFLGALYSYYNPQKRGEVWAK